MDKKIKNKKAKKITKDRPKAISNNDSEGNDQKSVKGSFVYFLQITKYIFPLSMILLSFLAAVFYKIRRKAKEDRPILNSLILLILFISFSLITLSFLTVEPFFRYLTPFIPVCSLILSLVVERCMKSHFAVGIAAIIIFAYPQPVWDYFSEITHDRGGPIEGIAKYLNQNGKK